MEPLTASALGGLVGALVGSYLATVLLRMPQGLSASGGRSRCDTCGIQLGFAALVPIVSFALQQGRCRHCGARIPRDHLAMELGAMLIGAASFGLFHRDGELAVAAVLLGWMLLLLAALDWRCFWLPDRLTLPLGGLGIAASLRDIGPGLQASLAGMLGGYASLWLVSAAYRGIRGRDGLGGGDPKLFGAIGAWLGWQLLPPVLLAAAGGGLALAAASALRNGRGSASARLPLGTLMAIPAWLAWLASHRA